jgi:hypothetical protein
LPAFARFAYPINSSRIAIAQLRIE